MKRITRPEKVKERDPEYLAVQARTGNLKGRSLPRRPAGRRQDLAGPFDRQGDRARIRAPVPGGVRDEAEIRGTAGPAIGSMPGKVIQSMKKAKTTNAFFLLDEIDKIGADWRATRPAACWRCWTRSRTTFNDHYLEVDYDLSLVMFVTTANSLNMPIPAGPHGDHPHPRLHRGREGRDRAPLKVARRPRPAAG